LHLHEVTDINAVVCNVELTDILKSKLTILDIPINGNEMGDKKTKRQRIWFGLVYGV